MHLDAISTVRLGDLNNDCLFEIFRRLSIKDTFQLLRAITDVRLQTIARQRIALFKHYHINLHDEPEFTAQEIYLLSKNLKSVNINAGYSLPEKKSLTILTPIVRGSIGRSLTKFTLNYVRFNGNFIHCMRDIFAQLEELNLNFCQLEDFDLARVLHMAQNLKIITLLGNYTLHGNYFIDEINSENLQRIEFEDHENFYIDLKEVSKDYAKLEIIEYVKGRGSYSRYLAGNKVVMK